jgi:two-component system sensor histidine kinase MprB
MTIAVAVAVAVSVALASLVAYIAVRDELRSEVDRALNDQFDLLIAGDVPAPRGRPGGPFRPRFDPLPARRGGPTPYIQGIDAGDRVVLAGAEPVPLPVSERAREVAAGVSPAFFSDAEVQGTHVRVLTAPIGGGAAAQLGRSLEPADAVLARLRLVLGLVILGGVALAIALGRLVSRNVVAPIVSVTEAARHIAATEDLGRRIEVATHDEVGELAQHFNAMLDTLERSVAAQRQLVADASHELRTPITSLRTNIEVLAESDALPADERARLLADVEEQTTELGMLVADLIELARAAPRAVNNLLDNARKHSPPGALVEVRVDAAGVRVRDHGTGVDPEDLPHLFDRFHRGASSRGRPGSGLGLAIVRQVAEQHGASVQAVNAPGGGAEFVLELPAVSLAAA